LQEEFDILVEYAEADGDDSSASESLEVFQKFKEKFVEAEQKVLLSGEADANNAIVSINAGAGGD
jgi:peptide chain release factor 2